MQQTTNPIKLALIPVKALFVSDSREGILLIGVALAALALANSALSEAYHALFHSPLAWSPIPKLSTAHLWINDALMAIFFFVVGLEVKRELVEGDLADPQARRLPIIAAVAGMAIPAALFVALVGDDPTLDRGWAIPAATDIAFAMGVVGLLGNRVPASLRLFLLTVAIVDDIGAVIIIAVFYTVQVKALWLLAAVAVGCIMAVMNLRRVDRNWPYIVATLVLWLCVLHSGLHATIAGVVAALMIPMRRADDTPFLETVEHGLAPWNAYLVVPVFALANAGVDMRGLGIEGLLAPLPVAIAAGLFLGKQIGIVGAVALANKLGIARLPEGASWVQLWGVSILCGIGFTMSLFIGTMAFAEAPMLYEQAKIGVLAGTFASLILGYVVLRVTTEKPED
ncbi:Na(+)/H(+) antiporter NhaA [Tsuneonella dongtanensis]|uniref:Na(+)/H(+) antiporter NhaA n=1 Tax=Tsuneonella dongtanensis TaxID=692370 RepID=A0A1B2AFI8_9SPHN|nr:Na+/H+ antiporter NhaA [Tsuneonella dongtanensis]ANY20910.1 Na(+)/H(+) antiporter NhaA [Tsuneonella dongtanensis]